MYKALFFIAVMTLYSNIHAQQNQVVFDTIAKKDILIGECNREGLMLPVFAEFYSLEYGSYNPDPETLPLLAAFGNDYRIVIVMASWCGDSKEQVPRFLKIADSFGFPEADIRIFSVDKNKTASGFEDELVLYNVSLVPTFIFYRGDEEFGRIVETPVESLEKDWLKILVK
ncbi:MAG: hypothetical protein A2W93_05400 [Bacteroidetes bacterium GWF2_43_63]|nr:MAG: hypothetical protein A2W94_11750 [Bacteroidetes bacterium GWE2_42_42]OFY56310.1 MAG: hypothetical protein A2W93_05400 [Bacteroidetes bacterium GWF2_43_63]HBG71990.1 thioredoxin [Bacteroidales bacterium]HCB61891.1 thioredoxin [Bacteroidales bacterium]HCY23913.1 thioredoxin [Bacteroidales bacterium]